MGGLVCAVPHFAILPGEGIPSKPSEIVEFDQRLRACFAQPQIVQGVVDAGHGDAACAILRKATWTMVDRTTLYDMLDSLYDDQ